MKTGKALVFGILLITSACSPNSVPKPDDVIAAINAGEYSTARILVRNALDADPANRQLAFLAGQVETELGNVEMVKTLLTPLLNDKQYGEKAPILLAKAYLVSGNGAEALALIEEAEKKTALAYAIHYGALMLTESPEKAVAVLEEGLTKFGDSADLMVLDGDRALALGDFAKAKAIAQDLGQRKTFHFESMLFAGRVAMMDRRFADANKFFDAALKRRPKNQAALLSKVSMAYDQGNKVEAKKLLTIALEELGESNGSVAYFRAQMAFDAGEYDKAHKLLAGIGKASALPSVAMLSGLVAAQRGQTEKAIAQLTSFLKNGGEDGRARFALASALMSVDQAADAWPVLKPLADSANASPQVLSLAAKLAASLKKPEAAGYSARLAVASKADPLRPQMMAADKAIAAGKWAEADAIYSKIRIENPGSTNVILLNNAALAKLELGSGAEAVEIGRTALKIAPNDPIVQDTLAWSIYRTSGATAEAVALMRSAADSMPGNPEIRQHAMIISNAMRKTN